MQPTPVPNGLVARVKAASDADTSRLCFGLQVMLETQWRRRVAPWASAFNNEQQGPRGAASSCTPPHRWGASWGCATPSSVACATGSTQARKSRWGLRSRRWRGRRRLSLRPSPRPPRSDRPLFVLPHDPFHCLAHFLSYFLSRGGCRLPGPYLVLKMLRKTSAAVWAHGIEEDKRRCLWAGCGRHFAKPFEYRAHKGVHTGAVSDRNGCGLAPAEFCCRGAFAPLSTGNRQLASTVETGNWLIKIDAME